MLLVRTRERDPENVALRSFVGVGVRVCVGRVSETVAEDGENVRVVVPEGLPESEPVPGDHVLGRVSVPVEVRLGARGDAVGVPLPLGVGEVKVLLMVGLGDPEGDRVEDRERVVLEVGFGVAL